MGTKTAAETTAAQQGTPPTETATDDAAKPATAAETTEPAPAGSAETAGTARAGTAAAEPATAEAGEAAGRPVAPDSAGSDSAGSEADSAELAGDLDDDPAGSAKPAPSGVGQGAGAVVSAALGVVSLSGGWLGTVAGARQQLVGQLRTPSSASVATQIKAVYGDAWHTTALWAGLFALAALVVGVVVLARPAFGATRAPQAPWIKSVSWAGVALGVIGLLLAVLKYTDALLGLPST